MVAYGKDEMLEKETTFSSILKVSTGKTLTTVLLQTDYCSVVSQLSLFMSYCYSKISWR